MSELWDNENWAPSKPVPRIEIIYEDAENVQIEDKRLRNNVVVVVKGNIFELDEYLTRNSQEPNIWLCTNTANKKLNFATLEELQNWIEGFLIPRQYWAVTFNEEEGIGGWWNPPSAR